MNTKTNAEIMKDLSQVLTMQYDYPPNGEGWVGYKGYNLYRFRVDDVEAITEYLRHRADDYSHSYNVQVLAQEIITDLLDKGLITYGGYDFKKQQKQSQSI